jgi:hypothetical protein
MARNSATHWRPLPTTVENSLFHSSRTICIGRGDAHFKRFAKRPRTLITTGWSDPVSGRELHPVESSVFPGALFRQPSALDGIHDGMLSDKDRVSVLNRKSLRHSLMPFALVARANGALWMAIQMRTPNLLIALAWLLNASAWFLPVVTGLDGGKIGPTFRVVEAFVFPNDHGISDCPAD